MLHLPRGKKDEFAAGKEIHPPVADRCTNCHSPHGSPYKYQLLLAPPDLCFKCHKNKKEYVSKVKFPHKPIQMEGSCVNCHEPHVSNSSPCLRRAARTSACRAMTSRSAT